MKKELGYVVPIHLQEPIRRDWNAAANPVVDDFYRHNTGAKAAKAAGWCFHNGDNRIPPPGHYPYRSFNMTQGAGRLYSQWDNVEQEVHSGFLPQIGSTNALAVRFQAEYPEQIQHDIGMRVNFSWQATAGIDKPGYLTKGPNIDIQAGDHSVAWNIKLLDKTSSTVTIISLHVVVNNSILITKDLTAEDFDGSNWTQVSLSFLLMQENNNVEFITYWHNIASNQIDWITYTVQQ